MPLFTDWGITLEEKYHVPGHPIREIEYINIRELITRLQKKNGGNTQQEPEKEAKSTKTKDSPTEIDSNNTFGA